MTTESTTAKTKTDNRQCKICNVVVRRLAGTRRIIESEEDQKVVFNKYGQNIDIGDILCDKCRKKFTFGRKRVELNPTPVTPSPSSSLELLQPIGFTSSSQTSSSGSEVVYVENVPVIREYAILPFNRTVSTHKYCCICYAKVNLKNVPFDARIQAFCKRRIFIPKNNVCCDSHLIKKRFYSEDIQYLRVQATTSYIEINELSRYLDSMAIGCDSSLIDKIGICSISEEKLKAITGFTWENINYLASLMTSMRTSNVRTVQQALVAFLFKLRSGNSNSLISAVLGLEREHLVSDFCNSVLTSFEKDILPSRFGFANVSREYLIANETSDSAKKLYDLNNKLGLIFDGTYIRHEKSANNMYQRKSYSGQKKVPLCKPFTICTTSGFVVDIPGPFYATLNDATIMQKVLADPNGLKTILKEGDHCFVDRGFRDVKKEMEESGYVVCMPALKGTRAQLPTEEANSSRRVTRIRWVVEAVHGVIGKKFKLLHHQLDNKLLPHVALYCKIVCFLNNTFGKRMNTDPDIDDEINGRMLNPTYETNTLAQEVDTERWSRRKVIFNQIKSTDLLDFPEMTERDLKLFFSGTYQLGEAISYLAEMMDRDNNVTLKYLKVDKNILKVQVQSRHINKKVYKCFIEYKPDTIGCDGILRYACDCANGLRTIGSCSHVAAIIYYLSHARYLSQIIRPAEILSGLFSYEDCDPVIEEDSDED